MDLLKSLLESHIQKIWTEAQEPCRCHQELWTEQTVRDRSTNSLFMCGSAESDCKKCWRHLLTVIVL